MQQPITYACMHACNKSVALAGSMSAINNCRVCNSPRHARNTAPHACILPKTHAFKATS